MNSASVTNSLPPLPLCTAVTTLLPTFCYPVEFATLTLDADRKPKFHILKAAELKKYLDTAKEVFL